MAKHIFQKIKKILVLLLFLGFAILSWAQTTTGSKNKFLDQEFWEKATIALVSVFLSFAASYLLYQLKRRREPRKELSFDIKKRQGLVEIEDEIKNKVRVLYYNREISDLNHIAFNIQNTGNSVIKEQYLRFEFLDEVSIVDKYFEPKPEREFGIEETKEIDLPKNEIRYLIKHLERGQELGFRFILTGKGVPNVKVHPYNESGDVEFIARSISGKANEKRRILTFITMFILFLIVPPVFHILPFEIGPIASNFVRLGLVLFILPFIKSVANALSNAIINPSYHREPEVQVRIGEVTGDAYISSTSSIIQGSK